MNDPVPPQREALKPRRSDAAIAVDAVAACLEHVKSLDAKYEKTDGILHDVLATLLASENRSHLPARLVRLANDWAKAMDYLELMAADAPTPALPVSRVVGVPCQACELARDDIKRMQDAGLSYQSVRDVLREYDSAGASFGRMVELLRAVASKMATDDAAINVAVIAELDADVDAWKTRAVKAESIIAACLAELPVGYVPLHTAESIPGRIAEMVKRYAETDRLEDERDALASRLGEAREILRDISNIIAWSDTQQNWYLLGRLTTQPVLARMRAALESALNGAALPQPSVPESTSDMLRLLDKVLAAMAELCVLCGADPADVEEESYDMMAHYIGAFIEKAKGAALPGGEGWIPCVERNPTAQDYDDPAHRQNMETRVLAYNERWLGPVIMYYQYRERARWIDDNDRFPIESPTHWMPLPAAPTPTDGKNEGAQP